MAQVEVSALPARAACAPTGVDQRRHDEPSERADTDTVAARVEHGSTGDGVEQDTCERQSPSADGIDDSISDVGDTDPSSTTAEPEVEATAVGDVDEEEDDTGWAGLPFLYYQKETSLAFGAAVIYYFDTAPNAENRRTSDLRGAFTYTLSKLWSINFHPNIYFGGDRFFWDLKIQYAHFPERFWGIGNAIPESYEVYLSNSFLLRSELDSLVLPHVYVGGILELESYRIVERQSDGLLIAGDIPGSDGGLINGLGVKLAYDDRDGTYFPMSGGLYSASALFFQDWLGSDYDFTRVNLDARFYLPTFFNQVLALQAYLDLNFGDVPFYRLAMLGGSHRLRGYYEGRFRDRHLWLFQADYRIPITYRWGVDVFGDVGQVFADEEDLRLDTIQYTGGAGVRFAINDERLNIRADFAIGPVEWGLYLNVGEAF